MSWRDKVESVEDPQTGWRSRVEPADDSQEDEPGFLRRQFNTLDRLAGHAVGGAWGLLPQAAHDAAGALEEKLPDALAPLTFPTGRHYAGQEPQTYAEEGARFVGESLPFAVGGALTGAARLGAGTVTGAGPRAAGQFRRTLGTPSVQDTGVRASAARLSDDAVNFAAQRPVASGVTEATGAFGAGALGHTGEATGLPGMEGVATLAGGLLGSTAPLAAHRGMRFGSKALAATFPNTEKGAKDMVASQLKPLVGDNAETFARRVQDAPPGMDPLQATGDSRLVALRNRIVDDAETFDMAPSAFEPSEGGRTRSLRNAVREHAEAGQDDLTRRLQESQGATRNQRNREASIVRQGVAPGAEPAVPDDAPVTRMMKEAYQTFDPAYRPFRDIPVSGNLDPSLRPDGDLPLPSALVSVADDPDSVVSEASRGAVRSFLKNQWSKADPKFENGNMTSGDLIEVRSGIRREIRNLSGATDDTALGKRRLLENAEQMMTYALEQSLGPEDLQGLRTIDSAYRRHKILQEAVAAAGDDPLGTEHLSRAIANANRSDRYAMGADGDLRSYVHSWRSIRPMMDAEDGPNQVRRMVQNIDPKDRKPLRAEFVSELMRRAGTTGEGSNVPRGAALRGQMEQFDPVLRELAGTSSEYAGMRHRLNTLVDGLERFQTAPEGTRSEMFTEGPAWIFELAPALAGASAASRISQTVDLSMGGGLVLAQRFASRFTKGATRWAMQRPRQLMTDMVMDKKLFNELMMREVTPPEADRAARALDGWAVNTMLEDERSQRALEDAKSLAQTLGLSNTPSSAPQ